MGFSYNVNVLNQKGSPALYTDTFANRPNFGYAGRLFIANDTSAIYEDTGTAWVLIANVSSGAGTLQQVTTNGNTSNVGISITAGGLSTNSLTDTALTLGSVLFSGAAGLVTQDNAAFFWDDTNNRLGINTTTPTNTLDLHYAGTGSTMGINNTAGNQSAIVFVNTGVNKWRIGNSATNTFDFYNSALASIAAYLDNTNNAATFNGSVQVLSSGGSRDTTTNITASISDSSASYNLVKTIAKFSNNGSGNISKIILSDIVNQDCNITFKGNATGANALFGIGINSFNNFVINGIGNVGIGITAPLYSLHIYNTTTARASIEGTTNYSAISFVNTGGAFYAGIDDSAGANFTGAAYGRFLWSAGTNPFYIYTNGANRLKIDGSTGNILINSNTDDTVNKLQVTGNIKCTGNVTALGGAFYGTEFTFPNPTLPTRLSIYLSGGAITLYNSAVGNIGVFNSTTGIYTPLSDINKKKDFEDSTIGLNAILNLKPTLYRMLDEENTNKHLGFIAQEVKEFIPQAYVESGEGKDIFIGLDFQAITTTLVKAVQEQQTIINSLLKRIEALENK